MDWNAAIETNREALRRVLATLVAMATLAGGGSRATLPRHLHRAVLRLLRPAESAARRLIIVAARGLVVAAPVPRPQRPKPQPTILRGGVGTGIVMPRLPARATSWTLPLFDPLRPAFSRPVPRRAVGVPRVCVPGDGAQPASVGPLSPDDPIDAARLNLRLQALGHVLDDLPRQARRFARWRACLDAARSEDHNAGAPAPKPRRIWPLRPGRPPGSRRRATREIDDILKDTHGLAFWALERPDTS